jgi:hypothetical protein
VIKDEKDIDVTSATLSRFYKQNRITYRVGFYRYWDTRSPEDTFTARLRFVIRLIRTLDSGREVIFLDETTFNKWSWRRRQWMSIDHPERVTIANSRESGYTLIGALSSSPRVNRLHYELYESGTAASFIDFLKSLFRKRPAARDAILVCDYAGIHTKKEVTEFLD